MNEYGSDAEMLEQYSSLAEVSARVLDPLARQVPERLRHRYYSRFQGYGTKTAREIDRDLLLGLMNSQTFKDEFTRIVRQSEVTQGMISVLPPQVKPIGSKLNGFARKIASSTGAFFREFLNKGSRIDSLANSSSSRYSSSILGTVLTIINRFPLSSVDRAAHPRLAHRTLRTILSPLMNDVSGLPSVPPTPAGTPQSSPIFDTMTGLPFIPSSPRSSLSPLSDFISGLPSVPNTPQPASWTLHFESPPAPEFIDIHPSSLDMLIDGLMGYPHPPPFSPTPDTPLQLGVHPPGVYTPGAPWSDFIPLPEVDDIEQYEAFLLAANSWDERTSARLARVTHRTNSL